MTTGRISAWRRHGAPAAVSVLLGAVSGILLNQVATAQPSLSAILGAVAAVALWALWAAWRAVRSAQAEAGTGISVTQVVSRVRGRLIGWSGPLTVRPVKVRQRIGTIKSGGTVIGADSRSNATRHSSPE